MRSFASLLTSALLLTFLAQAQPTPTFDVASIKPSPVGITNSTSDLQPGSFRGTNRTVEWMMRIAYQVQAAQISGGPAWLRSDGFDISAKTSEPVAATMKGMQENIAPLLRNLLEDRFALKAHRETRSAPVYTLLAAKNGPRLTPAKGTQVTMNQSVADGRRVLDATTLTTKDIAGFLARQLDRPVTDNTGLTATFDLHLEWSADSSPDSTAASIFSALQEQLGLKLEAHKGQTESIVVDSITHPGEN